MSWMKDIDLAVRQLVEREHLATLPIGTALSRATTAAREYAKTNRLSEVAEAALVSLFRDALLVVLSEKEVN